VAIGVTAFLKPYWASEPDSAKLAGSLQKKIDEFYTWADGSDVISRAERAYLYYFGMEYGGLHATSQVQRGGDQGELAEIRVNHSRALAQTLFNLIAAAKVSWQPVATNNDYASASQAVLAQNILEYYWNDGLVSQCSSRALEEAIPFCESFVLTEWDETLGEDFATDELGNIIRTGDIRFTNVMSWDVIRDPRKRSYEQLEWVILKIRRNKYDLAARYAAGDDALAQKILATPAESRDTRQRHLTDPTSVAHETDDVDCYYFFHKPTPACPGGKEVIFLSDKVVLKAEALTYSFWPIHRVFHSELLGTPFAYSPYHEILGVQEFMDSAETSIASNQSAFGTQNVIMEQGTDIDIDALGGGMKVFYKAPGAADPKAMQLCATPREVFEHLQVKKRDQEQLIGLNSVVRGEPLTGDQSGAALALLQAQAVQQSSGLQANYLRFVQSVGNAILELIRTRCPLPRRIAISGKANQFLQKEQTFTGQSIGQIRKVMVEVGNPMAQTAAGRVSIAETMIRNQLIKTPEQYLQVLATGRLEPMTQSSQNELLLILKENEQILAGVTPLCSVDDDHLLHAREHRGVLANPDARQDERVVSAYQQHILEHEQLLFNADPRRLFLMGQQPPPPMMAPPPPGAAPPEGPPPGAPPSSAAPNLPSMPTNPANGNPAPIPDGATLARPGPTKGPKPPPGGGQ
jgi:hypothetical protein